MINLLALIEKSKDTVETHNLNLLAFIIIYVISIFIFYSGVFLIIYSIYGSLKRIYWYDILRLKVKNLKQSKKTKIGILISLLGLIMPYFYILFWGRNFPWFVYIIIIILSISIVIYFLSKLRNIIKGERENYNNSIVIKKEIINKLREAEELWKIYDSSFLEVNKKTPCRQSFNKTHFFDVLKDPTALKYLVYDKKNKKPAGIAMVTTDLKNTPWISEHYFGTHFPDFFSKGLFYYFMGIAVSKEYRRHGYGIALIKQIIKDLPEEAIMGFDHSFAANPHLPYFIKKINSSRSVRKKYLDKQKYYIVYTRK